MAASTRAILTSRMRSVTSSRIAAIGQKGQFVGQRARLVDAFLQVATDFLGGNLEPGDAGLGALDRTAETTEQPLQIVVGGAQCR